MSPMIPTFSQRRMKAVAGLRRAGWTYSQIAKRIGKHPNTIRRYDRIYEKHGLEAFAEVRG